jgi:hypothetical protein
MHVLSQNNSTLEDNNNIFIKSVEYTYKFKLNLLAKEFKYLIQGTELIEYLLRGENYKPEDRNV